MPLTDFDNTIRKSGYTYICGVDEAGRGPLAGPVYAAAVVLPEDFAAPGLDDSKKLTAKKRDALYGIITANALAYHIAQADEAEIERLNILGATMLAMGRAVAGLSIAPDFALIDGNKVPGIEIPCEAVIGGDAKSEAIAAASILAKVARDRYLTELDAKYPQYAFAKHKGYGTKLHYQMLDLHGPCPAHRERFLAKWRLSRAEIEV